MKVSARVIVMATVGFVVPLLIAQNPTPVPNAQSSAPGPKCLTLAEEIHKDPRIANVAIMNLPQQPSCFLEATRSSADQAVQKEFEAIRKPLLSWLETYANGQQQGSSVAPGNSTNAVSKPSGPSSVSQEGSGQQSGSGSNATTLTISPGKTITEMELAGVLLPCDPPLTTQGCVSKGLLSALNPLSIKITANTNTASQSLTATASTPGSTTPTQPVTFKSLGSSLPSFRGLTVQYQILGTNVSQGAGSKPAKQTAVAKQYKDELRLADAAVTGFEKCHAYSEWQGPALQVIQSDSVRDVDSIAEDLTTQYKNFAEKMKTDPTCNSFRDNYNQLLTGILAANVYDLASLANAGKSANSVSLEYDFNTPANQIAYSSFKANGTFQFGPKPIHALDQKVKDSANQVIGRNGATHNSLTEFTGRFGTAVQSIQNQITTRQGNVAGGGPRAQAPCPSQTKGAQNAQAAANSTPPFSANFNIGADVYNSTLPAGTPSASQLRDIQAGTELDYRFDLPTGGCSIWQTVLSKIGSITAAGAYYYQDQTSPNVLKGPPSSITFTGLPSTATSVYAQRGVINLAQVRFGFGSGSKATFPIAATWSNRTELITHPTWGLGFGITYNLNSLFPSSKSQ